ncbi:MAG: ISL3 family transposase [Acidiferrobacter sp.]
MRRLKGLRGMLGMQARNRSKKQSRFLNALCTFNRRIHRAWHCRPHGRVLKNEFERVWHFTYPGAAKQFLRRWMTAALRSRLPSLKRFVTTVRNHFDNILSFIERLLTNAVGEGINRLQKIVKNRPSGFRGLEPFANLIFLMYDRRPRYPCAHSSRFAYAVRAEESTMKLGILRVLAVGRSGYSWILGRE